MLFQAVEFNQGLGKWDTAHVTSMASMFQSTAAFDTDIGGWVTSNVTEIGSMFEGAFAFNAKIGAWNVGAVTNMASIFQKMAPSSPTDAYPRASSRCNGKTSRVVTNALQWFKYLRANLQRRTETRRGRCHRVRGDEMMAMPCVVETR